MTIIRVLTLKIYCIVIAKMLALRWYQQRLLKITRL